MCSSDLWLVDVSLANLLLGNGVIIYLSLLAGFKRRTYGLVPFALLSPVYWLLHSLASYKALWQLVVNPFYWEKTTHGLSSHVQVEDVPTLDDAPSVPAPVAEAPASRSDVVRLMGPVPPVPGPPPAEPDDVARLLDELGSGPEET